VYSKSKAVTLATAQTLTGSDAVVGDTSANGVFDVRNNREVSIFLDWAKASATALEILVEASPVSTGDDWYPLVLGADAGASFSAGAVTQTSGTLRHSITVTGKHHLPARVFGAHRLRVKAKETGTPGGTLTLTVTAVQEAS